MSHLNNGACPKCMEIMDRYPGFYSSIKSWFLIIQAKYTDFHMSEAGRGQIDQEADFERKSSRAHWTESAHNWNAAFDGFFLVGDQYNLDNDRFEVVVSEMPSFIEWYGAPDAAFYERPHFQIKNWHDLAAAGLIKLVE